MSNALASNEKSLLRKQEHVIESEMSAFVRVGQALAVIRDNKLYREQFPNFQSYLKDRWGLSRSRGYALIEAASVQESLGPQRVTNVSQAGALGKLPDEERAEAYDSVVKQGKPTAQRINQEVNRRLGEVDDDGWEGLLEPADDPVIVQDQQGNTVPHDLEHIFTDTQFDDLLTPLRKLKRSLSSLADTTVGAHLPKSQVSDATRRLVKLVESCKPHALCPKCGGGGCPHCHRHGFVTASQHEALVKSK